jgi:hypothetical protein
MARAVRPGSRTARVHPNATRECEIKLRVPYDKPLTAPPQQHAVLQALGEALPAEQRTRRWVSSDVTCSVREIAVATELSKLRAITTSVLATPLAYRRPPAAAVPPVHRRRQHHVRVGDGVGERRHLPEVQVVVLPLSDQLPLQRLGLDDQGTEQFLQVERLAGTEGPDDIAVPV